MPPADDKNRAQESSRRELVERKVRRRSLRYVLAARRFDRRPRRDPDFIVAGAQKAGSTSLFAYLAAHPGVAPPLVKEINYFDLWPARGHRWYRSHFPLASRTRELLTGEASPMYMVHPLAMQRVATDLPRAKVVVILREPVSRLISHYRHSVRLEHEDRPLDEALDMEPARLAPDLQALERDPFHSAYTFQRFSYSVRSMYSPQVSVIQRLFPERHLFLKLEDLRGPEDLRPLNEFLGLPHLPEIPFRADNVNTKAPPAEAKLIPPDLLSALRADGDLTCDMLGWRRWSDGPR